MERSSKTDRLVIEAQEKKRSRFTIQVEEFMNFQRKCSTTTSSFLQFLWLLGSVHTVWSYILINQFSFSPSIREKFYLIERQAFTLVVEILVYILNVIMLGSFFGAKLKYKNRLWFSAIKKITSFYSFIARIILFLTAFLLLINFEINIAAVVLTIPVMLFDTLFIGNYCIRKQQNYQSSVILSLIFKIGVILQLLCNAALVKAQQPTILCAVTAAFGGFWLLWHRKGGYSLFISKNSKLILRLFIGGQVGIGVTCLTVLSPRLSLTQINLTQLIFSTMVVSFYLYIFQRSTSQSLLSTKECINNSFSLKQIDINLQILAEEANYQKNTENILVGVLIPAIKIIQKEICQNKYTEKYQWILNFNASIYSMIVQEKESLVRYYLKWVYQKAIKQNQNNELLLDFAEFGISSLGDFSSHCRALESAQIGELSFLQRIRAYKLRLLLREQSEAFNRLILGGRIELDEVMTAQEVYEKVMKDIGIYCSGNTQAWREMLMRQVDVSVLRGKFCQNFELIPKINEGFSFLSNFFSGNTFWKILYFNFALFLKNERFKNREIIALEQAQENIDFSEDTTPLSVSLTPSSDLPDQLFFYENSTIILCTMVEGKLNFQKTTINFEQITGYSPCEIIGSSLNMILPHELAEGHDKMVNAWLQSGQSTLENTCYVKRSHIVTKLSQNLNSLVAFKFYVDLIAPENVLKFMSLINISNKERKERKQTKIVRNCGQSFSRTNILGQEVTTLKKKISLDSSANIFLKDQNMQPASTISEIETIKVVMRLLTAALIIFIISLGLDYQNGVDKIRKHSQSLNTVINLYNMPMSIGRLYYNSLIVPVFYRIYLMPIITEQFEQFTKYSNSSLTRQIIFDSDINPPAEYDPDTVTSINQGIKLTSRDVYYVVVSALTTLAHDPIKMSPHDFSILNSYLQPAYATILNTTKLNLHFQLQNSINNLRTTQFICICCLSLILVTASIYICYKIYSYFNKMKDVFETIVHFNNQDIQNIIQYWQNVSRHFSTMTKGQANTYKDQEQLVSLTHQQQEENQQSANNKAALNQKHKDLVVSDKEKRKRNKVCILMIVLIIGFVPTILTIQIVNLLRISEISTFEMLGFRFIKYFPTTTVAAYALANKYYSDFSPNAQPYNPQKFKETISTLDLIVKSTYLEDEQSHEKFFEKEQNYLFGNPCTYNPEVLISTNSSMVSCLESGNKTLSNGIISYLRYVHPLLNHYLLTDSPLDPFLLKDLSTGLKLVGYYFSDAIETWFSELIEKVEVFYHNNLAFSILICLLLLLLHIFIFEWVVLSNLKNDFHFMRNIFRSCVPVSVLQREKIIKHQFFSSGILEIC